MTSTNLQMHKINICISDAEFVGFGDKINTLYRYVRFSQAINARMTLYIKLNQLGNYYEDKFHTRTLTELLQYLDNKYIDKIIYCHPNFDNFFNKIVTTFFEFDVTKNTCTEVEPDRIATRVIGQTKIESSFGTNDGNFYDVINEYRTKYIDDFLDNDNLVLTAMPYDWFKTLIDGMQYRPHIPMAKPMDKNQSVCFVEGYTEHYETFNAIDYLDKIKYNKINIKPFDDFFGAWVKLAMHPDIQASVTDNFKKWAHNNHLTYNFIKCNQQVNIFEQIGQATFVIGREGLHSNIAGMFDVPYIIVLPEELFKIKMDIELVKTDSILEYFWNHHSNYPGCYYIRASSLTKIPNIFDIIMENLNKEKYLLRDKCLDWDLNPYHFNTPILNDTLRTQVY